MTKIFDDFQSSKAPIRRFSVTRRITNASPNGSPVIKRTKTALSDGVPDGSFNDPTSHLCIKGQKSFFLQFSVTEKDLFSSKRVFIIQERVILNKERVIFTQKRVFCILEGYIHPEKGLLHPKKGHLYPKKESYILFTTFKCIKRF